MYHLHPDFVQDPDSIQLCEQCANAISRGKTPKCSYADFDPGRLSVLATILPEPFEPLSPLERIAVARAICFNTVVKLVSPTGNVHQSGRLPALKVSSLPSRRFFLTAGLTTFIAITFPHSGSQGAKVRVP